MRLVLSEMPDAILLSPVTGSHKCGRCVVQFWLGSAFRLCHVVKVNSLSAINH
jgi:hypothetical protein